MIAIFFSEWTKSSENVREHEIFVIFTKNCEIVIKIGAKNNSSQYFSMAGELGLATKSPYFVGDLISTPFTEGSAPGPGWKTIDWNSSPLVLVYYWLAFLNQVRFLNFWHFFCYFDTNWTGIFFMILTIIWFFIHCVKEEIILLENFPKT